MAKKDERRVVVAENRAVKLHGVRYVSGEVIVYDTSDPVQARPVEELLSLGAVVDEETQREIARLESELAEKLASIEEQKARLTGALAPESKEAELPPPAPPVNGGESGAEAPAVAANGKGARGGKKI